MHVTSQKPMPMPLYVVGQLAPAIVSALWFDIITRSNALRLRITQGASTTAQARHIATSGRTAARRFHAKSSSTNSGTKKSASGRVSAASPITPPSRAPRFAEGRSTSAYATRSTSASSGPYSGSLNTCESHFQSTGSSAARAAVIKASRGPPTRLATSASSTIAAPPSSGPSSRCACTEEKPSFDSAASSNGYSGGFSALGSRGAAADGGGLV